MSETNRVRSAPVTESIRRNRRHNRRAVQNRIKHNASRRAAERVVAGGHFVQHNAEREKVGTTIELLAPHLFR
jgi:hypothetical protein